MARLIDNGWISVIAPYYKYRRLAAQLVKLLIFRGAILSEASVKNCVTSLAYKLAGKYFARSGDMVLHRDAVDLFRHFLILAPIAQRDRLAVRMDEDFSRLSTWFRGAVGIRQRRLYYGRVEIERVPDVDRLARVMRDQIRISDRKFIDSCMHLMDCYYGRLTLSGALAARIFDPIMAIGTQPGTAFRIGNVWHRLEKRPFEGSIDLSKKGVIISDYRLNLMERKSGGKQLQVYITDSTLSLFMAKIRNVTNSRVHPHKKAETITSHIHDFCEHTRWAYSAMPQIEELSYWLQGKVQKLSATEHEASRLPKILHENYKMKVERGLFYPRSNFFFDPRSVSENEFIYYMSPYRWREYR